MSEPTRPTLTRLNHITLAVSDLPRSLAFYHDLLGLPLKARWQQGAYLQLADLWLCLSLEPLGASPAQDYTHVAFSCEPTDFALWKQYLTNAKIRFFKDNISEGDSLYFLDPDGHKLEIHLGNLQSRLQSMTPENFQHLCIEP